MAAFEQGLTMSKSRGVLSAFICVLTCCALGCGKAEPLATPNELPPLSRDWKAETYAILTSQMGEKEKETTKYLFLAKPVSCTVREHSQLILSNAYKDRTGYGGLVAIRQKGVFLVKPGENLRLYLFDERGKVLLNVPYGNFGVYDVTPELYTRSSREIHNGVEISTRPKGDPAALMKLGMFRKAPLEDLPPYM